MSVQTYYVFHDTQYNYFSPVSLSQQITRLTPRVLPWQQPQAHQLEVSPFPDKMVVNTDSFGNLMNYFALYQEHQSLDIKVSSIVSIAPRMLPDQSTMPVWSEVVERLQYQRYKQYLPFDQEATQFRFESNHVRLLPAFREWALACMRPEMNLMQAVQALQERIYQEFSFDPSATTISTPVHEVFERRRGVCQDFAHYMLSCLRSVGLAARYVSGYLLTHPPAGMARLVGADASHAWVSVYIPDVGWLDSDPTNNIFPNLEHITLGWGRDFSDVSPIRGMMYGSNDHSFKTQVTVIPETELEQLSSESLRERCLQIGKLRSLPESA